MTLDHSKTVLAGFLPDRRDNFLHALNHISDEHFTQATHKNLYQMFERYYSVAAGVMPKAVLTDLLTRSKVDVARKVLYEELFDELLRTKVSDSEFRWSVEALKDIRAQQMSGEAVTQAFEILERGAEVDGRELHGHKEMWEYLFTEGSRIEQLTMSSAAPEGDIRLEGDEIRKDYAERKARPDAAKGIMTGISQIDRVTSGYQPGELILVAAYTGEGKSQFVTNTAWHACVYQGKNVFFATTETIRPMVRRRILARHSRLPKFEIPGGLNSGDFKHGSIPEHLEGKLEEVIDDFTNNDEYGKFYIAQVPRGATLQFLEGRMLRQQAEWNIDLVVMDYLALLRAENNYVGNRPQELQAMIVEAKQISATFDNGRGVPLLSPWAFQQKQFHEARRTGYYTLGALSDTSEAEKSADQIMSLLTMPDQPNTVRMQFLKNRDGETTNPFVLETDYRNAYFGEKQERASVESLLEV